MTDRTIIGQRIAELRKNKGLTQAELADMIGVSHQAVSQWERSETLPDILTLPILADIFGQSIASVMGIEEMNTAEVGNDESEPEITFEVGEVDETISDGGNTNLDKKGETLNFKLDTYEILIRKNGKEINSFTQQPNKFIKVVVNGNVHTLSSDMSVTVEKNVIGDANSGFGMTICGDVGGNVNSGFETKCGNVMGNVTAGFGVNCNSIGGEAQGEFGVHENHKEKIATEGKAREINGDCDFDISDASSVVIMGDMNGNISNCNTVTIGADMKGEISDINGDVNIGGDLYGDVKADGDVNVDGDLSGNINCDCDVNVSGDVDGDIDAGGSISVGGDVEGSPDAGTDISVGGDVGGYISAGGDVSVGGDVDEGVSTNGDVSVGGDVAGGINTSGDVAVQGDVAGGIITKGDVSVIGDVDSENDNDVPVEKLDKNFGDDIAEYVKKVIRQHLDNSFNEK